jgi:hypothetical protein
VLAAAVAACAPASPGGAAERYVAPPPLALVVIVDASGGRLATQLEQLRQVVGASATPSETLVVTLVSAAGRAGTYVVRGADSLNAIAARLGLTLAALESANPQLGPVAGRDWNRIYPGDRVTIPDAEADPAAASLLVTRAPAGPPPPALTRPPERPQNPTTFQARQYERAAAAAQAVDGERVAAWRASAAAAVAPWQRQVAAELLAIEQDPARTQPAPDARGDLGASIMAAATTLDGLPGRRVLLVLGPGPAGPPDAVGGSGALAGIHLVVANLAQPGATAAWSSAATAGGARVTALDPALTDLQLPAAVTG